MIRKNPRGDFPQIHESAYVDQTAIICGKVIIEESVFVGPYAVIRADEGNTEGDMEPIRIGPKTDLTTLPKVPQEATDFSEAVVRTNHELVQGYKKLQNEF
jgi:carbonic anhydrase/acetyltransferase-like protein (isoleucine patch superfamily)